MGVGPAVAVAAAEVGLAVALAVAGMSDLQGKDPSKEKEFVLLLSLTPFAPLPLLL